MSTYDELSNLKSHSPTPQAGEKSNPSKVTSSRDLPSDKSRNNLRDNPREKSRERANQKTTKPSMDTSRTYPSREEIQRFSFQLRDELKIKVQAEVPHGWHKELDGIARKLDVKKLELYRFILGEFLGKVKRKTPR